MLPSHLPCPVSRPASARFSISTRRLRWRAALSAALLAAGFSVAAADLPLLEPAASAEHHALRAAVDLAANTGRLRLTLPGGKRLDLAVTTEFRDGFLHLRGRDAESGVSLVLAGTDLYGAVRKDGREFSVSRRNGLSSLVVAEPPLLPQVDDVVPTPHLPYRNPPAAGPQRDGSSVRQPIEVLAFLDPLVAAELGANGARASWLVNVDVSNQILVNSRIANSSLRTVGFVDYPVTATRLRDKLFAFQPDPVAIERRDAFGADFAALYSPALAGDTICGIAYLFGLSLNIDGSFTPFPNNDRFSAFSVSGTTEALAGGFACGTLTVPHEFGHNLAANHNPGNGGGSPLPYSVGDRCGTLNTADIMSNRAYGIFDSEATMIFSTPLVSVEGQPCGIVDAVDNARAVNETFDFASAYRNPPAVRGIVSLSPLAATVSEAEDELLITVTRDGDLSAAASVELAAIGDARAARVAVEGRDFGETVRRVEFPAGIDRAELRVPLFERVGDQGTRALVVVPRYPLGLSIGPEQIAEIAITDTALPATIDVQNPVLAAVENAGTATFRLTRSNSTLDAVSVDFVIGGGSATAGSDYVAASGTVNWPAGNGAARNVVVQLIDDAVFERIPDGETVNLTLSNPQGGAVLGSVTSGVLTISDNEVAQPGLLSFSAPTYSVSETGSTATIVVSRSGGADGAVGVAYAASAGTATAGADFTATSGLLEWPDLDSTPRSFTIAIADDSALDPAETVALALTAPTGGAALGVNPSATLTIVDNEVPQPGALSFSAAAYTVAESGGTVTITVNRSGGADGAVSVGYATAAGSATTAADYTTASGTLNWANLDSAPKTFTIAVTEDTEVEAAETVALSISAPTGNATLGATPAATLTITDNDVAPSGGGAVSPLLLLAGVLLRRRRKAS